MIKDKKLYVLDLFKGHRIVAMKKKDNKWGSKNHSFSNTCDDIFAFKTEAHIIHIKGSSLFTHSVIKGLDKIGELLGEVVDMIKFSYLQKADVVFNYIDILTESGKSFHLTLKTITLKANQIKDSPSIKIVAERR